MLMRDRRRETKGRERKYLNGLHTLKSGCKFRLLLLLLRSCPPARSRFLVTFLSLWFVKQNSKANMPSAAAEERKRFAQQNNLHSAIKKAKNERGLTQQKFNRPLGLSDQSVMGGRPEQISILKNH
jgi:hypothetical protein